IQQQQPTGFRDCLLADKKDLRIEEEEDDRNLNYIAPVQKSLEEIRQLDKNDESLVKYKQTLLGRETRPAVDKVSHMVGSYCPREEEHEFLCPVDEVPRGVMSRGHYKVMSHFTDDDKNAHLDWEWNFDLNKDWSE
uniref:Rho GDP dissociation inhibitor (GDI) gamma n=1 Tax=Cyclopterus lumpus TaxID=8103 RepID=A0A8C2XEG8_CYCLU